MTPRGIVIETRPDPDYPGLERRIRGQRRLGSLEVLRGRGVITKRHYDAVQRLLDDCSLAAGSRSGGEPGMPPVPSCRSAPAEVQIAAQTRVRLAIERAPLDASGVFWAVVFGNWTLATWDRARRVREGTARQQLLASCQNLDTYYTLY